MKKKNSCKKLFYFIISFLLIFFCLPKKVKCQYPEPPCDTTIAPEIWSQPVRLPDRINIKNYRNKFPFITNDGKTLYYNNVYGISKSQLTDTGWTEPVKLTDRINGSGLAQSPSVSSDGKKIYFVDFIWSGMNWDIFESDWDESLKNWGTPVNVKELNSENYAELTVSISRDGKVIFLNSNDSYAETMTGCCFGELCVSYWNDTIKKWNPKINLGKNINYKMKCAEYTSCGEEGASMTADGKKLYYCKNYGLPDNYDLFVSYKDSLGNWGKSRRLNINSKPDSPTVFQYYSTTGWDQDPSVTSDGKTIYFSSRRNVFIYSEMDQIWMSRLLVDENGNTVTNINDNKSPLKSNFDLYQNYPNPFNPETVIKYDIKNRSNISLVIYDIMGNEIRRLYDGMREPGNYHEKWDGKDRSGKTVTSGTYFYCLQAGNSYKVKKMLMLK